MKQKFLTLLSFILLSLSAFPASYHYKPDFKYACFLPTFSIDQMWYFPSETSDVVLNPMQGCHTKAYPGTIAWSVITFADHSSYSGHHWGHFDVYIYDKNRKSKLYHLCKITQTNASSDSRSFTIENCYGNTSYIAKSVSHTNDGATGNGKDHFLCMVTYYSDEVRNMLDTVSPGDIGINMCCNWQYNPISWREDYNEESILDNADCQLIRTASPNITNTVWNVSNNQSCVNISYGPYAKSSSLYNTISYNLDVIEGSSKTQFPIETPYTVNYHSPNLDEYSSNNLTHQYGFMPLTVRAAATYSFTTDYFSTSPASSSILTGGLYYRPLSRHIDISSSLRPPLPALCS